MKPFSHCTSVAFSAVRAVTAVRAFTTFTIPVCRLLAVFSVALAVSYLAGCSNRRATPIGPDLRNGKPVAAVGVLRDTTPTVQGSATVPDADAYVAALLVNLLKDAARARFDVRTEIYTSSPPGQSLSASRHHIAWSGKRITPRQIEKQAAEQNSRLETLFRGIEGEAAAPGESAILENLADLIRRLSELPLGETANRTCIVITDLEEFRTDFITTAQITGASETEIEKILARVQQQYPAVPRPPQKIVFVVTTPTERRNEQHRSRLRHFWERVCQGWGIGEVEFVNPPSEAQGGIDAHQTAFAQKDTPSGGLQEAQQSARQPTLTISNGTPHRCILRLVSLTDSAESVHDLPAQKATTIVVPEGRCRWHLEFPDREMTAAIGSAWFRPFRAYDTTFVKGGNGSALTFGEPQ